MATDALQLLGIDYLASPAARIYWGWLLLALAIALVAGRLGGQDWREWLGARVWWHPSARLDYRYFFVISLLKAALIYPLLIGAGDVAIAVVRALDAGFGYRPKLGATGLGEIVAYTLALFAANDFSRYWLHRAMHRVPWLWAIHRVHHSAEVLTPLTFYRVHPLESLLFGLRYALAAGTVTGVFIYLHGAGINAATFAGVNAVVLVSHLLGDNLRHSHLRLRYPRRLEHILISPAQHQLHHGIDGGQTNFGSVLALWDWCFGSLRTTRAGETCRFGIRSEAAPTTIGALLIAPFVGRPFVGRPFAGRPLEGLVARRRAPAYTMLLLAVCLPWLSPAIAGDADPRVQLGRALFFDPNLSLERRQSCSTCHDPERAFIETRDSGVGAAASLGDDLESLGDRNTPTLTYAALVPPFQFDERKKAWRGGLFWDGRAVDLADQARQPILNPIEMRMPDEASVVERVRQNPYYRATLEAVYGDDVLADAGRAYAAVADSIAAFERTPLFSPFDSRYDRYLRGEYELSDDEDLGMSIFFSTTNSNCAGCHQLKVMDDEGEPFSNFEYHNIGTPANLALRARNGVGRDGRDAGLGGRLRPPQAAHDGKFRVPGLRNVAVTAPYMHNGVFRDLRTVIEFYDQYNNPARTLNPETGKPWREAEIPGTISREDLKAKKLDDRKIDALIAFLKTLTDRRYEHLLETN